MKKAIFILMAASFISFGFSDDKQQKKEPEQKHQKQPEPPEPKKLIFSFTEQEVQVLFFLVDNAKADNLLVKEAKALLQKQYAEQMDTTKVKK